MSVNDKSPYLQLTTQIKSECKNCRKFKQKLKSIGQKVKKFKCSYLIAYKQIFQQMMQVNIEMNKKNSKQILQQFSALTQENKILKSLLAKVQQIKNTNEIKNHGLIYTEDKENIQTDNHTKKNKQQEKDSRSSQEKNLQQLVEISKAELQAQRLKYSELEALYKSSLEHNHRCEEQFLLLVRQTQQIKQTLTKLKTFQKPKQKPQSIFFNSSQNSQEQLSQSRQLELSSQQMSFTHSYSYELQTIKEVSQMDYQNQKQFKQHEQSYRQNSIDNHNHFNRNSRNRNNYQDQGPHTFSSSQLQLNNSQQNQQNLSMTRKFSINSNGFDIQIQKNDNDDLQAKQSKTSQSRDRNNEKNINMCKNFDKDIKNMLTKQKSYSNSQEVPDLIKSKCNNLNSQSQSSSLTITEAASIMNINIHNSCFLYDEPQSQQKQKQQKFCSVLESPKNYLQALNILKSFNSSSYQQQKQSTYKNQSLPTTLALKNKNRNKQNNCRKDLVEGSNFSKTFINNCEKTSLCSQGEVINQQFKKGQSIEPNQEKNDSSYIAMSNQTNNEIKLSHEKQGRKSFGKCWKTKDIKNQIMALNYQNQCDYQLKQLSELKPNNLFNTTPKMKANLTISYQNQIRSSTQQSKQIKEIKEIKEISQKAPARINPYYRNKNNSVLDNQNLQSQNQSCLFRVEGPLLQPEIKQEIKDFSNIIFFQNIFGGDMFRIKYKSGLEYEGKVTRYNCNNCIYVIPQGYGTLSDSQKRIIYTGEWKQGVFNGEGKLLITSQNVNNNSLKLKTHNNKKTFTVNIKNGSYSSRFSKKVTLIPKQYNGRFVNCQLQGDGTLIFSNGNKLICKMSQSSIQGQGVYFKNDGQKGTVISGRWVKNEMVQELVTDQK